MSTIKGLPELLQKFRGLSSAVRGQELRIAARVGGLVIQNEAKSLVRRKTGTTSRSIHMEEGPKSDSAASVQIGTDYPVGRFLELGTTPHLIQPKKRKALFWKGCSHPVKRVNHPGTKRLPWLVPAFRNKRDEAVREMAGVLTERIRRISR